MKIAICSEGPDPASPMHAHFGSSPWLLIHDVEAGTWEVIKNGDSRCGGQCAGGRLARTLNSAGVHALITGQCGAGVLAAFGAVGIPVYRCMERSPAEAAGEFQAGRLPLLNSACEHHGHEHHHGHHHGNGHHHEDGCQH